MPLARAAHAHRLAIVAEGLAEAGAALAAFARRETSSPQVIQGEAGSDTLDELVGGEAGAAFVSTLMGEDVESRRNFIQRNAHDVRFLDI